MVSSVTPSWYSEYHDFNSSASNLTKFKVILLTNSPPKCYRASTLLCPVPRCLLVEQFPWRNDKHSFYRVTFFQKSTCETFQKFLSSSGDAKQSGHKILWNRFPVILNLRVMAHHRLTILWSQETKLIRFKSIHGVWWFKHHGKSEKFWKKSLLWTSRCVIAGR